MQLPAIGHLQGDGGDIGRALQGVPEIFLHAGKLFERYAHAHGSGDLRGQRLGH